MKRNNHLTIVSVAVLLGACAQTPMGPTIQVFPQAGKTFEQFQQDQLFCKSYARDQVAGQAENANERAVAGTLIGAALGAAVGGAVGGGNGAGVGAAVGGVGGTAVGGVASDRAASTIQIQYDNAYAQCMYSKGNQVPGFQPLAVNAPVSQAPSAAPTVVNVPVEQAPAPRPKKHVRVKNTVQSATPKDTDSGVTTQGSTSDIPPPPSSMSDIPPPPPPPGN